MRGRLIIEDFVHWDSLSCERLVLRFCYFKLSSTSTDLMSYEEPVMSLP